MTILLAAVILSVVTVLSPRLPSLPQATHEVVEMATSVTTRVRPTPTLATLALGATSAGWVTLPRVDGTGSRVDGTGSRVDGVLRATSSARPTSTATPVETATLSQRHSLAVRSGAGSRVDGAGSRVDGAVRYEVTATPVIPAQNRDALSFTAIEAAMSWPTSRPTVDRPTPPRPSPEPREGTVPTLTAMSQRGPGLLRLWNEAEVMVEPASGHWDDETWQWDIPSTTDRAGWHTDSDDCGSGVTVIAGHSAWGQEGALMALNDIGEEDEVLCVDAAGQAHRFAPVDFMLGDGDDPRSWHPDWPGATLILYTCRPDFSGQVIVRFQEIDHD